MYAIAVSRLDIRACLHCSEELLPVCYFLTITYSPNSRRVSIDFSKHPCTIMKGACFQSFSFNDLKLHFGLIFKQLISILTGASCGFE